MAVEELSTEIQHVQILSSLTSQDITSPIVCGLPN